MAASSSSSTAVGGSAGLTRRRSSAADPLPNSSGGDRALPVIHPDVEPAPRPWPVVQKLAIVAIVALACLQFFPATHFRDPSDPFRSWIPHSKTGSSHDTIERGSEDNNLSLNSEKAEQFRGIHIFSWVDCLDLPVLAVLANSTLSSSRHPEDVYFHFLIPEDDDEKLSYYKLKVILSQSNIETIGEKDVKKKLEVATPEGNFLWSFRHEIPFVVIKSTLLLDGRFIYIRPDAIVKEKIDHLFGTDLGPYGIGFTPDCSMKLGDYVSNEILSAIQRSAAKSWVSDKPYDMNTCLPDFSIVLIEPDKLEKTLIEAIMWWSRVLNIPSDQVIQIRIATMLALYDKYLKLPSKWEIRSHPSTQNSETRVLRYDGPKRTCDGISNEQGTEDSNYWQNYLSPKSIAVLAD